MTNVSDYDYERYLNNAYIKDKLCQCNIYGYKVLKNHIGCEVRFIILYLNVVKIYYVDKYSQLYNIVEYVLIYPISDTLINIINKYCDMFNEKQLWLNNHKKIRSNYFNNCNLYVDQDLFIKDFINESIKCHNL